MIGCSLQVGPAQLRADFPSRSEGHLVCGPVISREAERQVHRDRAAAGSGETGA